jgi:hypothetical protein
VKLLQDYTTEFSFPVQYKNQPKKMKLANDPPTSVIVKVEGRGFNLFWPGLFAEQDSIPVDLEGAIERGYVSRRHLENSLKSRMPRSLEIQSLEPDTIPLQGKETQAVRVAVQNRVSLKPREGHLFTQAPQIKPDSVKIIGTRSEVQNIKGWPTQLRTFSDIHSDRSIEVPLRRSEEIIISPKNVLISLTAQKFTSYSKEYTIKALNQPFDKEIRFLPQTVTLHYLAPFNTAEKFKDAEFEVGVDVRQLSRQNHFALPKVVQRPKEIRKVWLEPNYVRYVIRERALN